MASRAVWSVWNALEKHGRREMRELFRLDCCIEAAAIVIDVCKHFEIEAEAVYCQVNAFNAAARRFLNAYGDRRPVNYRQLWAEQRCKWVCIGDPDTRRTGGYPGHVAVIAAGDMLIDLTLDQANRPQYDLEIPPIIQRITNENDVAFNIGKSYLEYAFVRDRRDFEETTAWRKRGRRIPVVEALIQHASQ